MGMNPVSAITFSCAAIHFISQLRIIFSVINGQFLSYHAYMVWEVKDPLSRRKCKLEFSPPHLIHHITAII